MARKKNNSTPTPAPVVAPASSKTTTAKLVAAKPSTFKAKSQKQRETQASTAPKKGKQTKTPQAPSKSSLAQPKSINIASSSKKPTQKVPQDVSKANQKSKGKEPEQLGAALIKMNSKSSLGTSKTLESQRDLPVIATSTKTEPETDMDEPIFRLAAATPIMISPSIERQFYESQLLLFVLERIRGEHRKRQSYYGELDQDETDLRRSFVDMLAYVCDFKKGGTTVTALALQQTYQGVVFWLAANDNVKPDVREFLRQVLELLKRVEMASTRSTETQLLALIVAFNYRRIDYYRSALMEHIPLCVERLALLENTLNGKPTPREIRFVRTLLSGLETLSNTDLVKESFYARQTPAFQTLAQLSASGKVHNRFYTDIRHLLGRLGEHVKAVKTIVSAALRFPGLLDEFEIKTCASPPSRCFFQSPDLSSLAEMASRIFTKEDEIKHYQEALETLNQKSDGALMDCMKQECQFKTRVHAELILVDVFYWNSFDFLGDDPYVGCSKPACFNCFQYILNHPGNFVLPACHNKLYLGWRSPDILEKGVSLATASRIREAITNKMNSAIRNELRRQIDGRLPRKAHQFDSVTGTSSSIQGGMAAPLIDDAVDERSSEHEFTENIDLIEKSSSEHQPNNTLPDIVEDSDDDLSWYKSRIQRLQTH